MTVWRFYVFIDQEKGQLENVQSLKTHGENFSS